MKPLSSFLYLKPAAFSAKFPTCLLGIKHEQGAEVAISLWFYEFMCASRQYIWNHHTPTFWRHTYLCACLFVCALHVCMKALIVMMLIKKTGDFPSHPVAFHQMHLFSSFMLAERGGGLSCLDFHCSACERLCVFHPASCLGFNCVCVWGSSAGTCYIKCECFCVRWFSWELLPFRGAWNRLYELQFHWATWFNYEDQLIMLLQQFLSLRWTCQALIWSLCS